jgi:hypothetical protein
MQDRSPPGKPAAEIIVLAEHIERAAEARDYGALADLDTALRSQAVALAEGRHGEAVDQIAVGALWTALGAVQRAGAMVDQQRAELSRRRGRSRNIQLKYRLVDET